MGMIKEFREFAMRGNMVDMAVGIIIGAAFGKIVSTLVEKVMMPPLGLLIGGLDFSDFKFKMKDAVIGDDGKVVTPPVNLEYGMFITELINFIIVAFAVFLLVKGINSLKRKQEAAPPPAPPEDVKLLGELRDLLKQKA